MFYMSLKQDDKSILTHTCTKSLCISMSKCLYKCVWMPYWTIQPQWKKAWVVYFSFWFSVLWKLMRNGMAGSRWRHSSKRPINLPVRHNSTGLGKFDWFTWNHGQFPDDLVQNLLQHFIHLPMLSFLLEVKLFILTFSFCCCSCCLSRAM